MLYLQHGAVKVIYPLASLPFGTTITFHCVFNDYWLECFLFSTLAVDNVSLSGARALIAGMCRVQCVDV